MAIYMKCTGAKQGVLTGGVTSGKFKGQIVLNSLKFGMGQAYGGNTASPTGKQVCRPFIVTKPFDLSTPLFLNACMNNEGLTEIVFTYVFEGSAMAKEVATATVRNAFVADFDHGADKDGHGAETIHFNYQSCDFTWSEGGIMASWDLAAT